MSDPDPEYVDLLRRLKDGDGDPEELVEALHSRYLALPRGGTTAGRGYPYPDPTDPIAEGADAIRALAEAIGALDQPWTVVAPASGWSTGSSSSQFALMRRDLMIFTRGTLYGGTAGSTAATVPTWARPRITVTVPVPNTGGSASTMTINSAGVVTFAGTTAGLSSGQISWMVAN